nr:2-cys peroxiredoxin (PRDX) chloroplastic [Polytomella parva]|eukprot:CAMPEP_0175067166 /NCGR_PEP_ID=MMETSP0052_2-20121109/16937_1 /TAXON_ID=51329 ORGANISM="Polytomella parva, Strain SAG 63-3" /NCGR_SAMPLE_ID=MMETSP0052_2 /ASSEMBLY_ACC=CAM_ASM_000194 /LENGTH=162 /DNA_ID=CAMNT_0016333997 /DNA_START=22 /DNA_END=510 /DNA_ORIENTATION=+
MVKTIEAGDKVPSATFHILKDGDLQTITSDDIFAKKKVVIFGLPGAFTPTCSKSHVPGFVERAAEFKAKGVDTIACISVNDAFVMKAWGDSLGVGENVLMLADGLATFTKAAGLDQYLEPNGLGLRSKRYAAVVEDGVVTRINIEEGRAFVCSRADVMVDLL